MVVPLPLLLLVPPPLKLLVARAWLIAALDRSAALIPAAGPMRMLTARGTPVRGLGTTLSTLAAALLALPPPVLDLAERATRESCAATSGGMGRGSGRFS